MARTERPTKTLTLSQLCDCLSVSARQVQYLRESGIVIPSVVVQGRGRSCLYSIEDALLVYIALVELPFMDGETKKSVLSSVSLCNPIAKIDVGMFTQLLINVEELRKTIQSAFIDTIK